MNAFKESLIFLKSDLDFLNNINQCKSFKSLRPIKSRYDFAKKNKIINGHIPKSYSCIMFPHCSCSLGKLLI